MSVTRRGFQPCPKAGGGKGPCGFKSRKPASIESCVKCNPAASASRAQSIGGDITSGMSSAPMSRSDASDAKINDDTGAVDFSALKKGDRTKAMQDEIINGMENLTIDQEEFDAYLDFASTSYTYSAQNSMLLWIQRKDGYNFKTYKQWSALGYQVKKGSKSASVLRPMIRDIPVDQAYGVRPDEERGRNKDGEETVRRVVGYSAYSVFPQNDLDAEVKEPPQNPVHSEYLKYRTADNVDDNQMMRQDLHNVAESMDIDVSYMSVDDPEWQASSEAGGYATVGLDGRKKIVVNTNYADHSQTYTLAHEMGHIACGHLEKGDNRTTQEKEVEAESVAYALSRTYGLSPENRAFSYLKGWTGGDGAKVKKSMTNVQKGLGKIIGSIEENRTGTSQAQENKDAAAKVKADWEERKSTKKSGKGKKK